MLYCPSYEQISVCDRYKCCAGYMPCSGKCGESRCPTFCLVTEVSKRICYMLFLTCVYLFLIVTPLSKIPVVMLINWFSPHQVCCCFGNSVSSTRFLLQDQFNIKTTKCDNCIIVGSLSLSLSHLLPRVVHVYAIWSNNTCRFSFLLGLHDSPQPTCLPM